MDSCTDGSDQTGLSFPPNSLGCCTHHSTELTERTDSLTDWLTVIVVLQCREIFCFARVLCYGKYRLEHHSTIDLYLFDISEMTVDETENDVTNEEEAPEEVEEVESKQICLKVFSLIKDAQQKHGLRHSDYQRYRGYCSRRLRRIRKAVGLVQGEKRKFNKKEVTEEILKEEKHLHVPLVTAERAWAYYMQLKFESNSDPRKKFHMINRLRKARKYAEQLEVVSAACEKVDARTKLETKAYSSWLAGILCFETAKWAEAQTLLSQARDILESLSQAVGEEEGAIFRQKMDEITPSLRYCSYNIGDASRADLIALRGKAGGGQDVQVLINQTREQQAATLQDVEWRGRKMAVKHEKVRMFLLSQQESDQELAKAEQPEDKIEIYESLLLDCKDALQVLRDELLEDPEFRNRQQTGEGKVSSSHFLYTYIQVRFRSYSYFDKVVIL